MGGVGGREGGGLDEVEHCLGGVILLCLLLQPGVVLLIKDKEGIHFGCEGSHLFLKCLLLTDLLLLRLRLHILLLKGFDIP